MSKPKVTVFRKNSLRGHKDVTLGEPGSIKGTIDWYDVFSGSVSWWHHMAWLGPNLLKKNLSSEYCGGQTFCPCLSHIWHWSLIPAARHIACGAQTRTFYQIYTIDPGVKPHNDNLATEVRQALFIKWRIAISSILLCLTAVGLYKQVFNPIHILILNQILIGPKKQTNKQTA